ncbi:MAG: urease subunit alpha [Rhodospirillaceae bacterium]|nr:urease subunit alpha [Rhodospirillaceae bacterium]|tara:strand:+ start:6390 stop:8099 length:1710 start_codon:yes stop_codon:yes gene_type:complete
MVEMTRAAYAATFGPTKGDRVRLGNTSLLAEVEHDHAVPGEELTTGGGKSYRDGMGMRATTRHADGALDLVIHNVLVIDPVLGIVKGDLGIREGRIVGIGKAGNPDVMDGVHPDLVCGPSTLVAHGEKLIATPGGIDVHVHFKTPDLVDHALSTGLTTLMGGGHGPLFSVDVGGGWTAANMLRAVEGMPINFGFLGRGSTHDPESIREHLASGIMGVKIHEDYSASPAVIDNCLKVADEMDFQVQIHTDTLNEAGFYETTMAAIGGRTIHMYHTEGAGGGHAPDIIRCNGEANCLPSSTNPTNPFTVNTFDEHLDMTMTIHHLLPDIPEDVTFAESRIRAQTIAAEDILHDLGAISMFGSDSMGMGRINEVVARCWQLASKMKDQRGPLESESIDGADNERIKRYLAKYTINAARVFGIDHEVGSLEPGKVADIVLWKPAFFGLKPQTVLKGGFTAWAALGDGAASIGAADPVRERAAFGAMGATPAAISTTFVHGSAVDAGLGDRLGLAKPLTAIGSTRSLTKADMLHNTALPEIQVNPESFDVFIDGDKAWCEPIDKVALGQLYLLR